MSTTYTINYVPRTWQAECHLKRTRWTVLVLHRRAGKTELALMELIDGALKCERELGLFGYVAPRRNQAKLIAWARLKQICSSLLAAGAAEANESELLIRFQHNGATIRLFGADNPDAIRGTRLDDVVLDEVAQMKPEVWYEVIRPALADRQGSALFIGTVKGVDLFSQMYETAVAREKAGDPDWMVGLWTVYDTEALSADEIERIREDLSENAWAREMMCDFTARGDDQILSVADVQDAMQRVIDPADLIHAPRVIGVDPARFGDDRSCIVKRQGLQMLKPVVLRDIDNMELASRVAFEIKEWNPDAVFIDAGAGSGIIDRLRQLGHTVVEVPFGSKALQPSRYLNRRAEMWWNMRDWVLGGGCLPDSLDLRRELATPIYWLDDAGRVVIESKKDVKKRLPESGSPDLADALCLTFAAPVDRTTARRPDDPWAHYGAQKPAKKRREFNPFSREEQRKRFGRR